MHVTCWASREVSYEMSEMQGPDGGFHVLVQAEARQHPAPQPSAKRNKHKWRENALLRS
jgi:hypothetical protein